MVFIIQLKLTFKVIVDFFILIHEVKIMHHAQIKEERLYIPPRDRQVEVEAKPALGTDCTHGDQILNAFSIRFSHYKETMKELSKV